MKEEEEKGPRELTQGRKKKNKAITNDEDEDGKCTYLYIQNENRGLKTSWDSLKMSWD